MEKIPYYSTELDRDNSNPPVEAYSDVIDLLNDPRLAEEISNGNITLAMIRPQVGPNANLEGLEDLEAADRIEEMIEGLGVMAKFSFTFTKEATEEFYGGGPQDSMSKEPPQNPDLYENRWPEFVNFMTSGPVTALLLHSTDGDAISKWRGHLGHWNIDQVRDEATIRGKFGVNKYNNLVHGSDSPEAVIQEISIIKKCLT